jgi:hypothetical protein
MDPHRSRGRIAGKNRFVTHIPNGGSLAAYNESSPYLMILPWMKIKALNGN